MELDGGTKRRLAGAMAGVAGGGIGEGVVHELGHRIAAWIYGADVHTSWNGAGFSTEILNWENYDGAAKFLFSMGGPIMDYVASVSALAVAGLARKDSDVLRPTALAYSMASAAQPIFYVVTDAGRDFSNLTAIGIPKELQIFYTALLSIPLMAFAGRGLLRAGQSARRRTQ